VQAYRGFESLPLRHPARLGIVGLMIQSLVGSIPSIAQQLPRGAVAVLEAQVDGDFNGWQAETIIKLMNGEVWQQTEYHYDYHYACMPKVLIYSSGGAYKMKMDGISRAIGVQRLR
jgi:hypothetical protein